jgi:hypothetical protein
MAARVLIASQSPVGGYPATPITANAADLTFTAGDATNGHYTPITDGKTWVQAHNTGAGARTLTITSAADPTYHRTGDITAYSLGAGEISKWFGPFYKAGWANVGPDIALANPSAAADDIIDTTGAHGLALHDVVRFTALTGGTGLVVDTDYWVIATSLGSTTFRVAATRGGSALGFSTDITAGTVVRVGIAEATPLNLWIDVSHAEMTIAVIETA